MNKIAIVVDDTIGSGFMANSVACISSGLFKNKDELYGGEIISLDHTFIPITKIPILIFRKNNKNFLELVKRAKKLRVENVVFTKEAQSTISYEEYGQRVKEKHLKELEILGIGILAEEEKINKFTGDLSLLK